jgi:hypothetical protein
MILNNKGITFFPYSLFFVPRKSKIPPNIQCSGGIIFKQLPFFVSGLN